MRNCFIISCICVFLCVLCNNGPKAPTIVEGIKEGRDCVLDEKVRVNVFVENSASMDGYVNGSTEFKNSIYQFLSELKNSSLIDTIECNYINSKIIPYKNGISDFIKSLSVSDFKARGGNRGTTDIAKVWNNVLFVTDTNDISILISDFIISPGIGCDANDYLINQQTDIKNSVHNYLSKVNNASVLVYQFMSLFDGYYYDPQNMRQKLQCERPYYVFIIGSYENILRFRDDIGEKAFEISTDARYKVENMAIINNGLNEIDYVVPLVGKSIKKTDKHNQQIEVRKDPITNKVRFCVDVKFPLSGVLEEYVEDKSNYILNNSFYEIVSIEKSHNQNYSHRIWIESDDMIRCNLQIGLRKKIEQWVDDANDSIGVITSCSSENIRKTYGIKYIVYGIDDAFKSQYKLGAEDCLVVFNLNIK